MSTTKRTICALSTLMLSALWLAPGCGGGEPAEETLAGWDAADGEDVSLTGTLVVNMTRHHGDDAHEAHPCEPEYLLYRSPEDVTPVRLAFDEAPPSAATGDELTVKGTLQGRGRVRTVLVDKLLGGPGRPDLQEDAELGQATQAVVVSRPPKHHKTAVLLVGPGTMPASEAKAMLDANVPGSAAAFIAENTGLIDTFEGAVFSYPSVDTSGCTEDDLDAINQDALDAFTAAGNKISDYQNIAFVYGVECGFFAKAQVFRPGSSQLAKSYFPENSFNGCAAVGHELGHNLGFYHAYSTKCGSSIYKQNRSGCTDDKYGNPFDIMGRSSVACTEEGHYSVMHKRYAGYLAACEDVTAGGSATFNLSPAEGSCGMRSLRIPVPGESNFYYLEYRKTGTGEFAGALGSDRVLLNVSNDPDDIYEGPTPYLLDATPSTSSLKDAWLAVGTTYTLPGNVKIKVESLGEVAKINVTMASGGGAKCRDGSAPAASNGVIGGLCGPVADKTQQAENYSSVKTCTVATTHSGYSGTGYVDFGDAGSAVEWKVDVPRYGQYKLIFRYANGGSTNRTSSVAINDQLGSAISTPFSPTGAWSTWKTGEVTVTLKRGVNKIRVTSVGAGPNIDQVLIKKL
jgi:hypothetical protein